MTGYVTQWKESIKVGYIQKCKIPDTNIHTTQLPINLQILYIQIKQALPELPVLESQGLFYGNYKNQLGLG